LTTFALVSQQTLHQWHIGFRDVQVTAQVALSLGALLRQDMISEGLSVLVAFRGSFEPLGSTTSHFEFGHFHTPHFSAAGYRRLLADSLMV
jgi:hypothetical protein